jgi:hypothetical protein
MSLHVSGDPGHSHGNNLGLNILEGTFLSGRPGLPEITNIQLLAFAHRIDNIFV